LMQTYIRGCEVCRRRAIMRPHGFRSCLTQSRNNPGCNNPVVLVDIDLPDPMAQCPMSADYRIEIGVLADVPQIVVLMKEYWSFEGLAGFEPGRVSALLGQLLSQTHLGRVWVAREGNRPVGYLGARGRDRRIVRAAGSAPARDRHGAARRRRGEPC